MSSAYWAVRSGAAVASHTPSIVQNTLASTVTSASYLGWRSKRRVTQENMATVLGLPATDARVRRAAFRSWSNYGRTAAALLCLPAVRMADVDARLHDLTDDVAWHEHLRTAMEPGLGTVITTGHFGSWDLAGAIAARHAPLSAIADTFKNADLNRLLQGHRRDKNVEVIPVGVAARRALADLRAARAVAILVDRPVSRERSVAVRFFGRTAYVPAGAAALATRTGAAVMPGYVWYGPHSSYRIRTFPPVFPRAVHGARERAQEIQRLTQYMFDCQEIVVRQCPTQWFMFRPFWPSAAIDAPPESSRPGATAAEAA